MSALISVHLQAYGGYRSGPSAGGGGGYGGPTVRLGSIFLKVRGVKMALPQGYGGFAPPHQPHGPPPGADPQ